MFWTVFRLELTFHRRQATTYLFFSTLFLLSFFAIASNAVLVGGGGQVMKNSPYSLAESMATLTAIGQVITTAVVGTAILRDVQLKSHELLFTTRVTRAGFLGGRFLGAALIMVFIYSAIPLGALAGSLMPWIDPTTLQPLHLGSYLAPFVLLVVPNVLFVSALFFAVGALTRNQLAIYIQGICLLALYSVSQAVLGNLNHLSLAALADPFGIAGLDLATRYWTVADKNVRVVPFTGIMVWNRVLWVAMACALVSAAFAFVRLGTEPTRLAPRRVRKRALRSDTAAVSSRAPELTGALHLPSPSLRFDRAARLQQLAALARFHFVSIVHDPLYLAIVVVTATYVVLVAVSEAQDYGTPVWPVTAEMVRVIQLALLLLILIPSTLYAGELTWKERQLRANGLTDALPASTAGLVAGKILAFLAAMVIILLTAIGAGIGVQTAAGYHRYEFGLYLTSVFGIIYPGVIQLTLLAFVVHAVVNNKFVGHVVMILYFVLALAARNLGLEHVLYQYGFVPRYIYSDMNGFGHYAPFIRWVLTYYTSLALVFGVMTYLAWVRGTDDSWPARWRAVRSRWQSRQVRGVAAAVCLMTAASGAVIYYNTNVLNRYVSTKESDRQRAAYERAFRQFKDLPHPRIVAITLRADLVPEERRFAVHSVYRLVNRESRALDSLYVSIPAVAFSGTITGNVHTAGGFLVDSLRWSRSSTLLLSDAARGVYLYRTASPIAPGDSLTLTFAGHFDVRGFPNDYPNNDIVANGTFLSNAYFPGISYSDGVELTDADQRKEQGLRPQQAVPSIDSSEARNVSAAGPDGDWIQFDAVVSTAPDQIAVAPGYLQREWEEGGRRVFAYHMDVPIANFFSIQSARYRVITDAYKSTALTVYYHPGHEFDISRMIDATKRGLDYYTTNFTPYQFHQFRIVEFPRYQRFAQSFPNTVPFSEGIGFITRVTDSSEDLDWPFFVTAHELAHQWWGNQLLPANVQGATMLIESLAEYSALTVMEHKYGRSRAQRFLRYELDRYLRGRGTERRRELPLVLVEDQPYIHYNKGSLAFYALRDYIGEDALNAALRRFLQDHAFQQRPPFPTTRDFLPYLRAVTPDSLHYVVHDLFETITLYDNKTTSAAAVRRPDGSYVVTVAIAARKIRADGLGHETTIPIADYIDVGVFGAPDSGNALGKPLAVRKVHVTGDAMTVVFVVPDRPHVAGIDPYNKLIDRTPEDNVRPVIIEAAPSLHSAGNTASAADSK